MSWVTFTFAGFIDTVTDKYRYSRRYRYRTDIMQLLLNRKPVGEGAQLHLHTNTLPEKKPLIFHQTAHNHSVKCAWFDWLQLQNPWIFSSKQEITAWSSPWYERVLSHPIETKPMEECISWAPQQESIKSSCISRDFFLTFPSPSVICI